MLLCIKTVFSQNKYKYLTDAFEISKKSHPQVFSLSLVSFEKDQFMKQKVLKKLHYFIQLHFHS